MIKSFHRAWKALRRRADRRRRKALLDLCGEIAWEGDLDQLRKRS